RIALGEDGDDRRRQVVDVFDERHRLLPAHVERRDRAREQDRVTDGEDGKLVAELDRLVFLPRALTRRLLLVRHDLGYLSRKRAAPGGAARGLTRKRIGRKGKRCTREVLRSSSPLTCSSTSAPTSAPTIEPTIEPPAWTARKGILHDPAPKGGPDDLRPRY